MPQMKDKRRTVLGWTCGTAAVLLGALAVAAPVARLYREDSAVIVTEYGDFSAAPEALQAMKWLSDRGRTNGFRFNADHELTHFRVELEAAAGFELPTGEFAAKSIRFNDEGQVEDAEYAASDAPGCTMVWIQDTANPRYWYVTCIGSCAANGLPCSLMLDLATLEMTCGCPQ
ncbi:MAG: hypothetical protein ACKO0W_10120 [Planctomycetota bacterium]